ncbi:MAG: c-type cytochrome [Sphingomonadaceae bacterium]|jgi:cytochrome c
MKNAVLPLLAAATFSVATYATPASDPAPDADEAMAEEVVEAEALPGEGIFASRCAACHSNAPGGPAIVGPNLHGVYGRAAGSGEFRYSPALKNSGITWDREQLDGYLTSPMKHVPGTRMVVGLSDADQRGAVIDYLESLSE